MGPDDPRATHPAVWASAAACAALVVLSGLLPGFTVRFDAYIITGNTERFLPPYERTHTLLGYGHPRYLAAVGAVLAALAAIAFGRRLASAWASLAAVLVAAAVGLALTSAVLRERSGRSGGVFLSDAVGEVQALALDSRAARHPDFEVAGFGASPEVGWWITQGALWGLLAIASVTLGRRRSGGVGWLALGYAATAILLVGLVPGADCGSERGYTERDPDSNPIGLLVVFGGAACAGLGLGALRRRAWRAGVLTLLVGVAGALIALYVLLAKDCGLDSG